MKVRGLLFGGLSTLALVLTACPSPAIGLGIGSVTFTTASVAKQALTVGDTFTYQATANRTAGNTTAAQTVTYISSNPSVLTIGSTSGVANAILAGTATITAKSTVDTSKTAGLTVTVSAAVSTAGVVSRFNAGGATVPTADLGPAWLAGTSTVFTCTSSVNTPATSSAATLDPGDGTQGTPPNPTINVSNVTNAGPMAIYQSNAFCHNNGQSSNQGDTLNVNLMADTTGTYTVRLHFSENYFGVGSVAGGAGHRVFDILAPGAVVATPTVAGVDVGGTAGPNKAYVVDVPVGSLSGAFTVKLMAHSTGMANNGGDPMVSGVELIKL